MTASPALTPGESPTRRLTPVGALNIVLHHYRLIAWCAGTLAVLTGLIVYLTPPNFTSLSSFTPQARRSTGNLAGLAAQFGLFVPGADPGQSPPFYSDLITSREILSQVADSRYQDATIGPDSLTLSAYFGKGAATPALQREAAIKKLRKAVASDVSLKTGVVELRVMTKHAELSRQINSRILDLVNEFNLRQRQSQAQEERQFIEGRLVEIRQDLRSAEDHLQAFLQSNRDYLHAPELSFQHDRLQRDVTMRQELFTSMTQAYEQAKIEEIRDSPVITVIERPVAPVIHDSRGTILKSLLALVFGLLLGIGIAFGREAVSAGMAGSPDELDRFRSLARNAARLRKTR